MTRSDYIKDQLERRWPEQFKNHKATIKSGTSPVGEHFVELIEWRNPSSWCYACRYIIQSQWLFAYGDLFKATYQWGERIDLKFLASLDLGYFLGKCRASPTGREWTMWDADVAKPVLAGLRGELEKARHNVADFDGVDELIESGCRDFCESAAMAVFNNTGDADLATDIKNAGLVPDCMAIGQFVGLKMAAKQLGIV